MIYTMTMNPALDYVVDLTLFKLGRVNRTEDEHIFYGGKGINVSVILKELGFESTCLGFIAGFTGDKLQRGVKEDLKLNTNFICVEKGMTRINVKIHSDQETELNGMGPVIEQSDIVRLFESLNQLQSGDILILSGSVPTTVSKTIYCDILEKLKDKQVKTVVDATGELLMKTLKYQPFLIKPNNHELEEMFHVKLSNQKDIVKYAKKLQEMGAKNVLISMAGDGALFVCENGKVYFCDAPKGQVVNSVGAGDSMVAGFIAGYVKTQDYLQAFKMGVATGSASAFSKNLATADEVELLLKTINEVEYEY